MKNKSSTRPSTYILDYAYGIRPSGIQHKIFTSIVELCTSFMKIIMKCILTMAIQIIKKLFTSFFAKRM